MKRILNEPLLHFFLLGAGLFLAYSLVSRSGGADAPGRIVVTAGQVEHLATTFARTWQRPPSDTELKGLIDDWVHEEIATREAMALGLDKDDTVIRRRLRQKLEFISDDIDAQAEPTDAELTAYLQTHAESFRVEPRLTFSQVYLDPSSHGDKLARDASRLLARLKQAGPQADISSLGDSFLLESIFLAVPTSDISRQFGEAFATTLSGLPTGQWQGPIESGYGVHLVLVSERTDGSLPGLADVRDAVGREWANEQRLKANDDFYQRLLQRYSVTIEGLEPAKSTKSMTPTR